VLRLPLVDRMNSTVTDPYLNLFRGIIPPLGGTLDLSPIIAFTVLNVFTSSAAALPCEMGAQGARAGRRGPVSRVRHMLRSRPKIKGVRRREAKSASAGSTA